MFDRQNVPGPIDAGGRKMLKNLPVFVGVKTEQTDKDNSILAGVNALVFPFPSSVELVGPLAGGKAQTPNAKLWTLAATSPEAWKQTGFFFFAPMAQIEEAKDPKDHGVFGLAYAYQGTLKSAYAPPARSPGCRCRTTCRRPSRGSRCGWWWSATPTSPPTSICRWRAISPSIRAARRCCSTPSAGRWRTRR